MGDDVHPNIIWFRRDLRLADNPALSAALEDDAPIVPVFIIDEQVDAMGAAPKWRLEASLRDLATRLKALGAPLILRRGDAAGQLRDLIQETGARGLYYNRDYTPEAIARDKAIKSDLSADGCHVASFNGLLLHEPWTVETKTGGPFRVYSPMWRAVAEREVPPPLAAPTSLKTIPHPPKGLDPSDLDLGRAMDRGASVVAAHAHIGEAAAAARLTEFLSEQLSGYAAQRDRLDKPATSGLSENLAYGEISPRQIWHAAKALGHSDAKAREKFLKELVWREFAYHLIYHTPHIATRNWREAWDEFGWRADAAAVTAWQRGQTGEPVIDAAMRELYVTGIMHNRARMIVASYLCKHLLVDWRVGQAWFAACLIDWDPASNAMGWQWVAGSGPDAAPYFRIFNPRLQAEKFDPAGTYQRHYLSGAGAQEFAAAIPRSWGKTVPPAEPIIALDVGRKRALAAYQEIRN